MKGPLYGLDRMSLNLIDGHPRSEVWSRVEPRSTARAPLSTAISFSFGGASSGGGCAGGALNRTVPTPACTAGTAGLTPVGAGTSAYDDASAVSKNALFANAEVCRIEPRVPRRYARERARRPRPRLDPDSSPAPPRSYSEYAAAERRRRRRRRRGVLPQPLPLRRPRFHRFGSSPRRRARLRVSQKTRGGRADGAPQLALSSSERDARQLSRSATVMNDRVRRPRVVFARGRGEGCRSRGRSRPSAAMLAIIALDGGSAVASPPAVRERREGRRRETPIGVPGSAGGTRRRSTPRRGPNRRETTGWDGAGRGLGGDATRARAESGVDASRASRRAMTRAAKRARGAPRKVSGEAKGALEWVGASRATAAGGGVYTFLAPLAGSARRAPASARGLR